MRVYRARCVLPRCHAARPAHGGPVPCPGVDGLYPLNAGAVRYRPALFGHLRGQSAPDRQRGPWWPIWRDWRGFEPDSGTVWEAAYAFAKGKVVVGYVPQAATLLERMQGHHVQGRDAQGCESGRFWPATGRLMLSHCWTWCMATRLLSAYARPCNAPMPVAGGALHMSAAARPLLLHLALPLRDARAWRCWLWGWSSMPLTSCCATSPSPAEISPKATVPVLLLPPPRARAKLGHCAMGADQEAAPALAKMLGAGRKPPPIRRCWAHQRWGL